MIIMNMDIYKRGSVGGGVGEERKSVKQILFTYLQRKNDN
jgi:hypothetical protein